MAMTTDKKATQYATDTIQDEIIGDIQALIDTTVLERFLVKAYEAGRAQEREELSAATRDRETLKARLVDRLHAGGFGLIGYDNVSAEDVADDMLDELGL